MIRFEDMNFFSLNSVQFLFFGCIPSELHRFVFRQVLNISLILQPVRTKSQRIIQSEFWYCRYESDCARQVCSIFSYPDRYPLGMPVLHTWAISCVSKLPLKQCKHEYSITYPIQCHAACGVVSCVHLKKIPPKKPDFILDRQLVIEDL